MGYIIALRPYVMASLQEDEWILLETACWQREWAASLSDRLSGREKYLAHFGIILSNLFHVPTYLLLFFFPIFRVVLFSDPTWTQLN